LQVDVQMLRQLIHLSRQIARGRGHLFSGIAKNEEVLMSAACRLAAAKHVLKTRLRCRLYIRVGQSHHFL
jgi:hypothetical protein